MTLPNTVTFEDILPIMIELRKIARELNDYRAADIIRNMLLKLDVVIEDYKNKTRYYIK